VNLYFKQKVYSFLLKAPTRNVISKLANFKGAL